MVNNLRPSVVVAKEDRDFIRRNTVNLDIHIIPIGVDADYFNKQDIEIGPDTLIFHGGISYPPNADAVIYFYKEIYPLIKKEIP